MKLTELQNEIIANAIQEREKAKAAYMNSHNAINLAIALITGEKSIGNWELKDGELFTNIQKAEEE